MATPTAAGSPKWMVMRTKTGELEVIRWAVGGPAAVKKEAPHTQLHENWDATALRGRLFGLEGFGSPQDVVGSFLDDVGSKGALEAGLRTPKGRQLLAGIWDQNQGGDAAANLSLRDAGPFSARWAFRTAGGSGGVTAIRPAAGIFVKLVSVKKGVAYVHTLYPIPGRKLTTL